MFSMRPYSKKLYSIVRHAHNTSKPLKLVGPCYSPLPGFYRDHLQDLYQVTDTVFHSETNEHMVLYKSLKRNNFGMSFVKPTVEFNSFIKFNKIMIPRFQLVTISKCSTYICAICKNTHIFDEALKE